jgi:hypothetical protein
MAVRSRFVVGMVVAFTLTANVARAQDDGLAVPVAVEDARAFCERTLGGQVWARTELYFGMSRAAGPDITEGEFQHFLDTVVTPRFPAGLTVLSGDGQFRGASGIVVQERSKVLILFYPWGPGRNRAVERIRARYKRAFAQEAVLRVDTASCVSF